MSAIIAAAIEALGGLLEVIVGHKLTSRKSGQPSSTGGEAAVAAPEEVRTIASGSPGRRILLRKNETYIDPETNFIVVATLVLDYPVQRAWMTLTVPDGVTNYRELGVGQKVDFRFQNRRLFMLVEKMDPSKDTVTIQILEHK
jgi:hypothetical protein